MKLYVYCDDQEHPLAEAKTMSELARKAGLNKNTVYRGFKYGWKPYVVIDTDDDEEDE